MATTKEVLAHHLQSFGAADLSALLEDYTPETTLFTPDGILRGPEEIGGLFEGMIAEFAKPGATFEMLKQIVDGEIAYIVWKAETADNVYEVGTDTFVIRGGKIVSQTFAGKIVPKG